MNTVAVKDSFLESLEYENEVIIRKFMQGYDVLESEAELIFNDTLKWLYLCAVKIREKRANGTVDFMPFIETPIHIIDKMWHTFVLFTLEYDAFCRNYFGFFIHHSPTTFKQKEDNKKLSGADLIAFKEKKEENRRLQYKFLLDQFGRDLLYRWYQEYPKKYTRRKVHKLRKY